MFSTAETWFLPEGSFDHSPMLLQVHQARRSGASPFRFYKMWCTTLGFLSKVRELGLGDEGQGNCYVLYDVEIEKGEKRNEEVE